MAAARASRSVTQVRLPYPVPYAAQAASPELIPAFFDEGRDPATDPRWAESGAEDPAEYASWVPRACGPACVKMAVEALEGPVRRLVEWARAGAARCGYIVNTEPSGETVELGWRHQALADLVRECGFTAQVATFTPEQLLGCLREGNLVIASVSYELGTDRPITHRGGHLVVLTGASCSGQVPLTFMLHNPSGRTAELRENARIPIHRFRRAYSGRGIAVGL